MSGFTILNINHFYKQGIFTNLNEPYYFILQNIVFFPIMVVLLVRRLAVCLPVTIYIKLCSLFRQTDV
jgi:hypothetical protein